MNSKLEKCLFNISKYRTQLMGIAEYGLGFWRQNVTRSIFAKCIYQKHYG